MRTSKKKRPFFDSAQKSESMKISDKEGVILIISLLLISIILTFSIVSANVGDECSEDSNCSSGEVCIADECALETSTELSEADKAYQCLETKVEDKCDDLSPEEQAFSLLALGYDSGIQSECKSALQDKSNNDECWPSGGCRLRDTSLAILALNNINSDTDDAEDWLLEQTKVPDLEWYLQIDQTGPNIEMTCTLTYSGTSYTIIVKEDKKINKAAGSCLSLAQSSYWLKISDSCIEKNFTISCNKDFLTSLLYKKPNSNVWHVPSTTNPASADGQTQEIVESSCFEQNGNCNYEGSLWATLALSKTGHSIKAYLPYLIAYSEDNEKLAPNSFLYMLTNFPDYFASIINSQNTEGFWDLDSPYTQFYDTALNLLAMSSSEQAGYAQTWLLDNQGNDNCWGSVRDTAFILYAAWPKTPSQLEPDVSYCTEHNYYCVTQGECTEAKGNVLANFYCSGTKICCDEQAIQKTCEEQKGEICASGYTCDDPVSASNTLSGETCCKSACLPPTPEAECEEQGNICKTLCADDEEEKSFDCTSGEVCCGEKAGKSYWWIWLLIILIILLVLAIIFRDKFRLFLFKFKSKFKKGPATTIRRPPFPPTQPSGIMSRPIFRAPPQQARPRPSSAIDKELEDTLKKLREIGK